jgi:hypothetical protein
MSPQDSRAPSRIARAAPVLTMSRTSARSTAETGDVVEVEGAMGGSWRSARSQTQVEVVGQARPPPFRFGSFLAFAPFAHTEPQHVR